MRGFYEDYQKEKQSGGNGARDRPVMIKRGAGTAAVSFIGKLATAVLYIAATALSSVGLTTLLNKPLRDMLFELVRSVFWGS